MTDKALFDYTLRLGDNCLVLAQRISEWVGHAPVLEEDIAMGNVALDMVGQTQLWLGLAGEIEGKDRSADNLAYLRDAHEFRNLLLVEQPNGDFAHTLMRQFLFDAWHYHLLEALTGSSDKRVAEIAEKAVKEASYHLVRSTDLVVSLGDGTDESHARMQQALDDLWPYTGEMFMSDEIEEELKAAGIAPDTDDLQAKWDSHVAESFDRATLSRPEIGYMQNGGKRGVHSEHLGYLIAEMQFLQRAYPGATW